jgi:hypothetical protein
LLAATRRYASQTSCLGIANGLFLGFGMFFSLPPRANAPVERHRHSW